MESYLRRCAITCGSPNGSFTATSSTSPSPCARIARKKLRPIRPKPLTPTRTAMSLPPSNSYVRSLFPLQVTVVHAHRMSEVEYVTRDLLGQNDRTVVPARAADRDREVVLALADERGQKEVEQILDARDIRFRLFVLQDVVAHALVGPRQVTEVFHPVRIGK